MELVDSDGDRLEFRIDPAGKLCEYVNGKLEIPSVRFFAFSALECSLKDDTGTFTLREEPERLEKILGLRALAARAVVEWLGDEPQPVQQVVLTDTDGDCLEFVLTHEGKLEEKSNGSVELEAVEWMSFSLATGVVQDPGGEFTLRPHEVIQKAAALRSLASAAGVEWRGDEPWAPAAVGSSSSATRRPATALQIEDCDADWELRCPKLWEALTQTANPNERFCNTCKETVFLCNTEQEVLERTRQRCCVAFEVQAPEEAVAASSAPAEELSFPITVIMLSGQELPEISVKPSNTVRQMMRFLESASGIPRAEQRLVAEGVALSDGALTLRDAGVVPGTLVQIARVPAPDKPPKRMGKRRPMRR